MCISDVTSYAIARFLETFNFAVLNTLYSVNLYVNWAAAFRTMRENETKNEIERIIGHVKYIINGLQHVIIRKGCRRVLPPLSLITVQDLQRLVSLDAKNRNPFSHQLLELQIQHN